MRDAMKANIRHPTSHIPHPTSDIRSAMAQRRHHYERAFEGFLGPRRIPYVAVDEARKALVPNRVEGLPGAGGVDPAGALKSFDFVIYGDSGVNLLVDIKGRRVGSRTQHS